MSTTSVPAGAGVARPLVLGLLLGALAIVSIWLLADRAEEEYEQYFPRADAETLAKWTEEWHRRGDAWMDPVPDPPGDGPIETVHYWLARDRYDLQIRRRGSRVVVVVAGVAEHQFGGGWAAYGEGRIEGPERGFDGAVATFVWSCLGLRYRHASDGIGRIVFSDDGSGCTAMYMAWEAPDIWAKSYGERHEVGDEPPPYGAIRGQIPISEKLPVLPPEGRYRMRIVVRSTDGTPIPDALVQLKGHPDTRVSTDAEGRCELAFTGAQAPYAQALCAGAVGYLNGETPLLTGDAWPGLVDGGLAKGEVLIELRALELTDDPTYAWQRASGAAAPDDAMACGTCHPWHYDQWYETRHARMADSGHVTWEHARMLAHAGGAPDDCAGCHQPAHAATMAGQTNDPAAWAWKPRGVTAGNHCDLCHKIQALTDVRESGVLGSYSLLRPGPTGRVRPGGIHHVFGTAPDVSYAYMGSSYNPLFASSDLCAGCHQGGGRWRDGSPPKIDTYGEWQRWVASRPADGARTCQDCHMPGAATVAADGRPIDQMAWDALHRSPDAIHDHGFGGVSPRMGRIALRVEVAKRKAEDGTWVAEVSVTNTGAGHKVPTGTWSKHVIVGVWAEASGKALRQLDGDRALLGNPPPEGAALAPGDWRDPGGFILGMRVKLENDNGSPTQDRAPPVFWAPWKAADLQDDRLAPGATRTATCRFEASEAEPTIEVRVLHRRGWLPRGTASTPWTIGPTDPQPEVLWMTVRK